MTKKHFFGSAFFNEKSGISGKADNFAFFSYFFKHYSYEKSVKSIVCDMVIYLVYAPLRDCLQHTEY